MIPAAVRPADGNCLYAAGQRVSVQGRVGGCDGAVSAGLLPHRCLMTYGSTERAVIGAVPDFPVVLSAARWRADPAKD